MLVRRLGAALAVAAMPWIALTLGSMATKSVESHQGPWGLESTLSLGATAAAALVASYLAMTAALGVIEAALRLLAKPRAAWKLSGAVAAVTPAAWSRVVATALGLSLFATPAMASSMDSVGSTSGSATWLAPAAQANATSDNTATPGAQLTSAGWPTVAVEPATAVPAAPATQTLADDSSASHSEALTSAWGVTPQSPAGFPAEATAPAAAPSSAYVVQPGDSLWDITAALLGDSASPDAIAGAWPSLYEANREVIGTDPGLIYPGTALTVPAALSIEGRVQP